MPCHLDSKSTAGWTDSQFNAAYDAKRDDSRSTAVKAFHDYMDFVCWIGTPKCILEDGPDKVAAEELLKKSKEFGDLWIAHEEEAAKKTKERQQAKAKDATRRDKDANDIKHHERYHKSSLIPSLWA